MGYLVDYTNGDVWTAGFGTLGSGGLKFVRLDYSLSTLYQATMVTTTGAMNDVVSLAKIPDGT